MYAKTFDILADAVMTKDKDRLKLLVMNENMDTKLNRRIMDYLVCTSTYKLSRKNLEEALDKLEL